MLYLTFKRLQKITAHLLLVMVFVVGIFVSSNFNPAFALNCSGIDAQDPSIAQIMCPVLAVMNILLYSGAGIFIIMVLIGAYKYAMSLGDPKAAMGARSSLTYAVIGFIVIFLTINLITITGNILGVQAAFLPANVFGTFQTNLCNFLLNNNIAESLSGC